MGKKFNTVEEVISWKKFTANGQTYDLSHLNAHWVEYLDDRDINQPINYRFIVTYGFHCFTKDSDDLTDEQSESLMYHAPRESRPFNFERYHLSKQLPNIIKALDKPTTLVIHAGYGKYAASKPKGKLRTKSQIRWSGDKWKIRIVIILMKNRIIDVIEAGKIPSPSTTAFLSESILQITQRILVTKVIFSAISIFLLPQC